MWLLFQAERHHALPEHLCRGQLDRLLGEGLMSGSVAVVASGERTVGSEELVPAGSEGCNANDGN